MSYVFTAYDTAISWKANLQKVVTFSTTKVKYIIMKKVMKETLWLKGPTKEMKVQDQVVTLYCVTSSEYNCLRTKFIMKELTHVNVQLHFIREKIAQGYVKVMKVSKDYNPYMITKFFNRTMFFLCVIISYSSSYIDLLSVMLVSFSIIIFICMVDTLIAIILLSN